MVQLEHISRYEQVKQESHKMMDMEDTDCEDDDDDDDDDDDEQEEEEEGSGVQGPWEYKIHVELWLHIIHPH